MFDIGFAELMLLTILGLVVIGPERMPEVARQIGRWVGAAKRTTQQFQRQLETEVKLDELNRQIMTESQAMEKQFAQHQPDTPEPEPQASSQPDEPTKGQS